MHWGKHHRTYVTNLNNQIKDKPLANKTLEEVMLSAPLPSLSAWSLPEAQELPTTRLC